MDDVTFGEATREDLPAIIALLADDELGARRERSEDPLPASYHEAFAAISADPAHELLVARLDGALVATMQLSVLPYLTHQGGRRGQIEAVRVASSQRGSGLGKRLLQFGIERARERGCHLVQLTTDKQRPDALRFYLGLGFEASHEGMKLTLLP